MKPHEFISYALFPFLVTLMPEEPTPLFQSDEPLSLTLCMDVRKVLGDVGEKRDQHPALISYSSPDGETLFVPVKIRTRGHFRRDPMNCDFPPLRLNFSDQTAENSIFEGQDKLKLVSHCRSRGEQYEQNILKEYLAYRLYNLFTEESYRVRLVEMTFTDSEGRRDTLQRMAFIIEPTVQMTSRNRCNYIEIKNVQQEQCMRQNTTLLSVFQYMIGNTDWSVPVPHNIDLIQEQPGVAPVAVPYDFDWCGLVDAPYAVPAGNLGIDDVRTRIFRGCCVTEDEFEQAFREFRDRRDDIFKTIESIPHLKDREQDKIIRYIEQFYRIIDNPRAVKNEFYNKCRTK